MKSPRSVAWLCGAAFTGRMCFVGFALAREVLYSQHVFSKTPDPKERPP